MSTSNEAAVRVEPNLFSLSGHGVHVTYASSGIDGQPSLTYQDTTRMETFRGDELRVVDGDLGRAVSVSIERTIDTGSTSFSLLIPRVELSHGQPMHIMTLGVTALHRFSVLPLTGQLDTYHSVRLDGTASLVEF